MRFKVFNAFQKIIPVVVLFTLLANCSNDKNKLQKLQGRWTLTDAEDNELNVKDRMVGIFFDYSDAEKFKTNFSPDGDTASGTFFLKDDKIIHQSQSPIIFTIEDWKDSTMILDATLKGHEFKLWLQKE